MFTDYVDEILISDPRENSLISSNAHKRDELDTYELCRLHRLWELKKVYHSQDDQRAVFKAAVQHYMRLVGDQTAIKLQIKGKYRTWGVPEVEGQRVYSQKGRADHLHQIKPAPIAHQLTRLYELLDTMSTAVAAALEEVYSLGQTYPEIKEFEKIPGVGPVCAHLFDAFIQTPERFATKAKLWRYAQLSITDRSSDGKPLGYQKLERSGIGALKSLSYCAWKAAASSGRSNEVRAFYEHSLRQTHDATHARLNTQRKILSVMWSLWKHKEVYQPEIFSSSTKPVLVLPKKKVTDT
ncbi:MAG: transposase [Verrucomicrobiota bacterium]